MTDWKPISQEALRKRVEQGVVRMDPSQLQLWRAIEIEPVKWTQHPYGDEGEGFWVVAIIGNVVVWYNDREDGFNRSVYSTFGEIEDYMCNSDELEITVDYIANAIRSGQDIAKMLDLLPKRMLP
jgi:hypothetical protein